MDQVHLSKWVPACLNERLGIGKEWEGRIRLHSKLKFTNLFLGRGHVCCKHILFSSQPTTCDSYGGRNNTVTIQRSDFEVMEALNSDEKKPISSARSVTSTAGSYGQLIPSHNTPVVVKGSGLHSSVPPSLPPHLLNVNLNKGVPNINEPSLLQEPDHVSVNHLYALSIKVCLIHNSRMD